MKNQVNPLGMFLFVLYLLLYLGFVLLTAFKPDSMSIKILNLNLAVFYGFGLIIVAFLLAIIYGIFAKSADGSDNKEADS